MDKIKVFFNLLFERIAPFRKLVLFLFPKNTKLKKKNMRLHYLEQLIYNYYNKESIINKKFYNIGAGNQRSSLI
jgi:hypothetical protein